MSDYPLTAGQQQQLVSFLNAGKAIYIEGNDFGYFQSTTAFYKMFGANYAGDGNSTNNVQNLNGERATLLNGTFNSYVYGSQYPDQYVDFITSNGADILLKCQQGKGRLAFYSGPNGTYRTIYSTFWFGAMKNSGAAYTKAELMDAYVKFLKGDGMMPWLADHLSATTGGEIALFLERPVSEAGRLYAVVGTVTGTSPGTPVGSVVLPINFDAFTSLVIAFWNTPLMPLLFLASALSTGLAVAMIGAAIIDISTIRTLSNFALGHVIFLSVEGVVLLLFVFMSLTRSVEAAQSAMMLLSGALSPFFWALVVVVGILAPFVLSIVEYYEYGRMPKYLVVGADLCVLIGGISLRALIIYSGTAPQVLA